MRRSTLLGVAILAVSATVAHAEKVDMAKLTCADMAQSYLEEVIVTAAWMSGFFNGKNGNTAIDIRQLSLNSENVVAYCRSNPTATVMDAVQKAAK